MLPENHPTPAAPPPAKRKAGRPPGSLGWRARRAQQITEDLRFDPLEFLLATAKDARNAMDVRLAAASRACGFCHARLSTVQLNATSTHNLDVRATILSLAAD